MSKAVDNLKADADTAIQPTGSVDSANALPGRWRWIISTLTLLIALALQFLAGYYPVLIERYYSRNLYLYIGRALSFFNRYVGFSLAESLAVVLIIAFALILTRQVWKLYKRRLRLRALLLSNLVNGIGLAGGVMMIFLLLWGFNYERQPLAENLRLERREANVDELESISRALIAEVNHSYSEAMTSSQPAQVSDDSYASGSRLPFNLSELNDVIENSYQHESMLGLAAKGEFGPPKPVYFSSLMSELGISGIYSPFTGEPNFNALQPDCELPFTIAHEKAHQRGYALEDEANFIAFLICTKSSNPYCRYSGYLLAASHVLSALNQANPDRYHKVFACFGAGPRADLKAMRDFWLHYEGRLSQFSETVNNTYLKANHVGAGIENYSEVVELILGYYYAHPVGDACELPSDETY